MLGLFEPIPKSHRRFKASSALIQDISLYFAKGKKFVGT